MIPFVCCLLPFFSVPLDLTLVSTGVGLPDFVLHFVFLHFFVIAFPVVSPAPPEFA